MKAILDTNFILTCLKQKIDFLSSFSEMGIEPVIPEEVIAELKRIKSMKQKKKSDRDIAELALDFIGESSFEQIVLGSKKVDNALVKYAKENPETIIATLDGRIRKRAGRAVIITDKKKIEVA